MRKHNKILVCCSCIWLLIFILTGCGGSEELSFASASSSETEQTGEADVAAESGSDDTALDTSSEQQQTAGSADAAASEAENESDAAETSDTQAASGTIFVHVCGAVVSPGVYELSADARIYEALEATGGCTSDGSPDSLNLAQGVSDGQRVYVPTKEEAAAAAENGESFYEDDTALTADGSSTDSSSGSSDDASSGSTLVNINTATKEELMTLTGIGEAKAESIIQYREENGGFQTIEDLMQISGIKEGVFEKIKDDICV